MAHLADITQRTVSGIGWTSGARVVQQVLQFGTSVILARILVPADFGLVGLVVVFTGFASVFVDFGFASALIQRSEVDERHLSSAFWLNVVLGLVLSGVMILIAPTLASFYREQRLVDLTSVLATVFVFNSVGVVQMALLERRMNFRRVAAIETSTTLLGGAVAIAAALSGKGVWSLVWLTVVSAAGRSLLLWCSSDWHPRLLFDRRAMVDLWRFSRNLAGFNALNYWSRNSDNLMIGKFVGAAALGIYSRAYTFMLLPLSQITMATSRVMFPALSRLQDDPERVRRAYLRAVGLVALVTFPLAVGLFVSARPLVLTLFGAKWSEVIPVLRILSVVALTQSIGSTVGWIYQSQGRTDWMFRWSAVTATLTICTFAVGIHWGVWGVATAYAGLTLVLVYFNYSIPGRLIGMTFSDVFRAVRSVLIISLTMGVVVWIVGGLVPSVWPSSVVLLVETTLGIATYVGLTHLLLPGAYVDLRSVFGRTSGSRRFSFARS